MAEEKEFQPPTERIEEEFAFTSLKLSSQRSPFFYVDLATRYLRSHDTLEISGLGQAMEMVVTVVEILKKKGIAQVVNIRTSSLEAKSVEAVIQKAQLTITVARNPQWNPPLPQTTQQISPQQQQSSPSK